MAVVWVLIVLALVGLVTWAIVTWVPMPVAFQRLIIAVAVIGSIYWVLSIAGLVPALGAVRVPHR